ncbi:hypothetical protein [Hydrogenophaga sp.]|uniref:hypothetical protein n=1 Tax=Hydrogenophaga sp. TaxID=1904254 RepID=UPI00271B0A86|nr:hypothetical protein [Hydrogenophaga sp.]MDO8905101.1 hypothetical protein [Hydrogenophaga sp.]
MQRFFASIAFASSVALTGCAPFPQVVSTNDPLEGLSARQVFDRSLAVHGGDLRKHPGDINFATDGRWYQLIQRIQPVVTDARFRVASQERYRPSEGLYAVRHTGPDGVKQVVRSPETLKVHYNGVPETDAVRLRATAMTSDAFRMFHFGPTFFLDRAQTMTRLADETERGVRYHRLLVDMRPGFGEAANDQAVLWIDADNYRLYRIHQTLNGFETTQGAHVDTTFLDYRRVGPYLFPVRFLERVRGPLRLKAHAWEVTGIELDRGWRAEDVRGAEFAGPAAPPVADFSTRP